jgi:lipopolysaccharide biosynthesis glycosyltransferase
MSLKFYSDLSHIDLLVLTSNDLLEDIRNLSITLDIDIRTHIFNFTEIYQACCARLFIFDYPKVSQYKNILYLDTDILIQNDIRTIVNYELKDIIYAFKEGTIDHPYWGGDFFDFSKINPTLSGFNSGVLLFKPVDVIKDIFSNIINHVNNIVSSGSKLPDCQDQALLNYHFIKEGLYNLDLMDKYVKIYSKDADLNIIQPNNIISHFTWPIGNANNKLIRMKGFFINILKSICKKNDRIENNIIERKYMWSGGFIEFKPDYVSTLWGNGKYYFCHTHIVYAEWNDNHHILKFSENYDRYISIRIQPTDLEFTCCINYKLNLLNLNYEDLYNKEYNKDSICFIHSCHLYEAGTDKLDLILNAAIGIKLLTTIVIHNIGLPLDIAKYRALDDRIIIIQCSNHYRLFELPTLKLISEFSKKFPNTKILYLHTKGISYGKMHPFYFPELDWINYMLYFLCKKSPDICIDLLNIYDVLGCDYMDTPPIPLYFRGNFWWATAKYLSRIPINTLIDRTSAEWWILSANANKHILHNSKRQTDPYNSRYLECEYITPSDISPCISRIPKIFFQTSKRPLPSYIHDMIRSYLPDYWTYTNYIDGDEIPFFEKYPLSDFPDIVAKFRSLKRGEHRADLFRYYYLYVNGGVYMDSDAMIFQNIDTIVKDYSFISVNSWIPNTISNYILMAEKGSPIIYKALSNMYSLDFAILDKDFHYICKDLYNIYKSYEGDKSNYMLFNDIQDPDGDRLVDSNSVTLFRHYWRNKENIPNHTLWLPKKIKSKNLIYFCVFYNKDYFQLLSLLLKTMIFYSPLDTFDILVITSPEFETEVKNICLNLNLNIQIMTCDFKTIFQAACARLFIFDYAGLDGYDKCLYLDTDIIIKGDLTKIFELPMEKDLLYAIESGNIQSPSFGCQFFNFHQTDPSLSGMNSGTLLFKNSTVMRDLFERIRTHVNQYTQSGLDIPYCMDQPFINYHAIKDNLYDNTLLNPHVSLFEGNDEVNNYATSSICHFSFPIGNFGHKFHRMREFVKKITGQQFTGNITMDLIGRKYSWGSNGYIKFLTDDTSRLSIETTWGKGIVIGLDKNVVYVEWHGHGHVLKLNEDLTSYISIRIGPMDFDFTRGSLIKSNLNIYGDSHALVLFRGLNLEHRNLFQFAKTMYRVGRDQQIVNFRESHNDPETVFFLAYGEVDVRAHVGKQVHYGRHHEHVCRELVHRYLNAVKAQITFYRAIIIMAVPPPTAYEDHAQCTIHTPSTGGPLPFAGINSDRVIYTQRMNELLADACSSHGFIFFNPFSFYTRENGTLKYELSDKCIHVGNSEYFLEQFYSLMNGLK